MIVCTHFIQVIVVLVKMVKERLARIGMYLHTCGCTYVRMYGVCICTVYVYEIMYTFLNSTCGLAEELSDSKMPKKTATSACGNVSISRCMDVNFGEITLALLSNSTSVLSRRCLQVCKLPLLGNARFQARRTSETLIQTVECRQLVIRHVFALIDYVLFICCHGN